MNGRNSPPQPESSLTENTTTGEPCGEKIRPIIPVRYSLKHSTLYATHKGEVPAPPTGLTDEKYDLRRLRVGYFYIFIPNGEVSESTDAKQGGKWQIFEYSPTGNSAGYDKTHGRTSNNRVEKQPNSYQSVGTRFHFRKYLWPKGRAKEAWKLDSRTYPYAFVHEDVSLIEYAYSEERWPAEVFELLESNPNIRQTLMQPVNLTTETTDCSFPFTQLSEKVTDFDQSLPQQTLDSLSNQIRRTALGYSSEHKITISCEKQQANARIVVVSDPLGNIADVSCFHEYTWANALQEQQKYAYAVTTAKAVNAVKETFTTNKTDVGNWFVNGYPIPTRNQATMADYVGDKYLLKHNTAIANIAKVHQSMLSATGAYSVNNELDVVLHQAAHFARDDMGKQRIEQYASFLFKSAFQELGISTPGMKLLAGELKKDKTYGKLLSSLLSIAQQVAVGFAMGNMAKGVSRVELEILFECVTSAQVYAWCHADLAEQAISKEVFFSAWGVKSLKQTGSYQTLTESITAQTKAFVQQRSNIAEGVAKALAFTKVDTTTARYSNTGNQKKSQSSMTFYLLVNDEQTDIAALQKNLKMTHRIGVFLATASLIAGTVEAMQATQKDPEIIFLKTMLNPYLQFSQQTLALIAAFEYDASSITSAAKGKVVSAAKAAMKDIIDNEKFFAQAFEKSAQGLAKYNITLANIGRFANVLGVVIAAGQGWQAYNKSDRAGVSSAAAVGLAEVCFFAATFMWATPLAIAGILFVLAAVFLSWFTDNDYESWARNGFWGSSDKYWRKKREKNIQILLKETIVLSNPNDEKYESIKMFFNEEMQYLYDLVWAISVQNQIASDKKILLYCPAFNDASSLSKLSVEWHAYRQGTGRAHSAPVKSDLSSKIKRQFLAPGYIELDFTAAMADKPTGIQGSMGGIVVLDKNTLTLRYPHTQDKGNFETVHTFNTYAEI